MSSTNDRYTAWSVTINNPVDADHEDIAMAKQKGWKVTGQLEKGAEGTLHYQLMVKTPQCRFSALKKAFSRAHIEPAKHEVALLKYVTKEDTRVGDLPSTEKYPSMSKLWTLLFERNRTGTKDGWNECSFPYAELYREDDDARLSVDPLKWFDNEIMNMIDDGYHVESLATNPAVRSAFKKYGRAIMTRCYNESIIADKLHNNALEEEVSIPTPEEELQAPCEALCSADDESHEYRDGK